MISLSNFGERLHEFTILQGYTPKMLAQAVGVSHATILNAISGRRAPSTKLLFGLLKLFKCSADYLLGITDDYPDNVIYRLPVPDFGTRFAILLKETGVSQYSLTKTYGISGNLIYQYLQNQTYPSPVNMVKLAKAFGCSIDYLLNRTDF